MSTRNTLQIVGFLGVGALLLASVFMISSSEHLSVEHLHGEKRTLEVDSSMGLSRQINSARDTGRIHNVIVDLLESSMVDNFPKNTNEYLKMAFIASLNICDSFDIKCKLGQAIIFVQQLKVERDFKSHYDSHDIKNLIPEEFETDPAYAYLKEIHEIIVELDLKFIVDTTDGLDLIMNKAENDEALDEKQVEIIQSVASVASSSIELWTKHLTDPSSALFKFFFGKLRQMTSSSGSSSAGAEVNNEGRSLQWWNYTIPEESWFEGWWNVYADQYDPDFFDTYTMTSFDYGCFVYLITTIVLRDAFGGIRRIIIPVITTVLLPNPISAATIPIQFLQGAVLSSMQVLGIDRPAPLFFHFFEFWIHFWYNIELPIPPTCNNTILCDPFTWELQNETNTTSFFDASVFLPFR